MIILVNQVRLLFFFPPIVLQRLFFVDVLHLFTFFVFSHNAGGEPPLLCHFRMMVQKIWDLVMRISRDYL